MEYKGLKIDYSHRLCGGGGNDKTMDTINNIDLVATKLMAKLEILTDAVRSDSFDSNNEFLESYFYGLIDDVGDIQAISRAHSHEQTD